MQFKLHELESEVRETLFFEPLKIDEKFPGIREKLIEEMQNQDAQYAVDKIALEDDIVEKLIADVEEIEDDEEGIEKSLESWFVDALRLKKRFYGNNKFHFRYMVDHRTIIPHHPWLNNISSLIDNSVTWRRTIASQNKEVSLLRPGLPLVDIMERFTLWDDRGSSFLTHRVIKNWPFDDWLGFKVNVNVKPRFDFTDMTQPTIKELAKMRRIKKYLNSIERTFILNIGGQEEQNSKIIEIVRDVGYRMSRQFIDTNIGNKTSQLFQYMPEETFRKGVMNATKICLELVQRDNLVFKALDLARDLVSKDISRLKNNIIEGTPNYQSFVNQEFKILNEILGSLEDPIYEIKAIGFFILNGNYNQFK